MKKITLLSVMAGLCTCIFSQDYGYDLKTLDAPLFIGDYIKKTTPLGRFINYKKDTASLADFEGRLVILSFWFTTCGSCVAMFPKEDALQKQFNKNIQFIMVTYEPEQKVRAFIKSWEQKNNTHFNMPVIVGDTVLRKAIRNFANPNYAWLLPEGKLVAQTTEYFINSYGINAALYSWAEENNQTRYKAPAKNKKPVR
ncbi:hypothetical protein A8C56_02555 [Niabella ginsenosidivorans]|uniref:Redoxin domain-containing protein n=1 Tax=Niabella ginsenosidivorans TaxID=1176587 RepID=A0A1A9HX96_9BACT|nr:TlpA disulfide reductase family protein [Niabella ginsenosidivorans]ANH80006.1 hypothetical protein A8C56_02555 [Niabella ginsenosidivorans]